MLFIVFGYLIWKQNSNVAILGLYNPNVKI